MSRINVGIVRGGPSNEYEVSLNSGATVLKHLDKERYAPYDIFITKDGTWYHGGLSIEPIRALRKVDVVFNALHGEYGEDGKFQHFLETHNVPYTGSSSFSSAVGINKVLSKKIYERHGIKTPLYKILKKEDHNDELIVMIFKTFPIPAVVKPATTGSSVGIRIVQTLKELREAVELALTYGDVVLIEEYIKGVEATCGVVEGFRGEPLHALMPIEIRPKASHFFDYDSKYTVDGAHELCPGHFSSDEKKILEDVSKKAHHSLGLRHYSRSDFIVSPRRGIYILETNSLPGLTETSLLPKALVAGGTKITHFLDHVLQLALGKK